MKQSDTMESLFLPIQKTSENEDEKHKKKQKLVRNEFKMYIHQQVHK